MDNEKIILEDTTNYPAYYVIDKEKNIELQWLIDKLTDHLHGSEAVNIGNVVKYLVRYGKKEPSDNGRRNEIKKMITYLLELDAILEKRNKIEPIEMPDDFIDDPLHDED
jgi:hypothetical protein